MSFFETATFMLLCPLPSFLFSITTTQYIPPRARLPLQVLLLCVDLYLPIHARGRYDVYLLSVAATGCFAVGLKMLVWIADGSRAQGNFFWTLWFWREAPTNKTVKEVKAMAEASNRAEPHQTNKTMTEADVTSLLRARICVMIFVMLLLDLLDTMLKRTVVLPPAAPYFFRLLNSLRATSAPTINLHELAYSMLFVGVLYLQMIFYYEIFTVLFAFALNHLRRSPDFVPPATRLAIETYLTSHLLSSVPLFEAPYLSTSPNDLWSNRWHQMFRFLFRRVAYNPTHRVLTHLGAPRWIQAAVSRVAVFALSGLLHEYILAVMYGTKWWERGLGGWQTAFFMIQATAVVITRDIGTELLGGTGESNGGQRLTKWAKALLTMTWIVVTVPLFIEPYVRAGYYLPNRLPLPSLFGLVL